MNGNEGWNSINIDYVVARVENGLRIILGPSKATALVFVYFLMAIIHIKRVRIAARISGGYPTPKIVTVSWGIVFAIGLVLLIYLIGAPIKGVIINRRMERIGMINKRGECPLLIDDRINRAGYREMIFFAQGIPLADWEKYRPEICAALNMEIGKIETLSGKWQIRVCAVSAKEGIPKIFYWHDGLIIREEFVLNLGRSIMGPVTLNLKQIPHVLLGGSTGSGKSVLLKSIIYQCYKKGADMLIADFKGGVDYGRFFKNHCIFVTDIDDLIERLDGVVKDLHTRKELFAKCSVPNIDAYNHLYTDETIKRIVIAFDEIAEVLDKTGLTKVQREKVAAVEEKLATIARLGRAFGIHLLLSTQRPDATILSGQIRNNIDARFCGRADDVLSKIILDNTQASEGIAKNEQGLFMTQDGTIFRAYFFDDKWLA